MTLTEFFEENPKVALGFSGGADSAFLLYTALQQGAQVRAYFVKTAFQSASEYEDACRLARELGADMKVLELDILADPYVVFNPANRCYYCKKRIFSAVCEAAQKDGFPVLMDGNNASDDASDRPGMRALAELGVRSPLREAGLTKAEIRRMSREAGLFTHDKPANACLATRIPSGMNITRELLTKTEAAEENLKALGFSGFRVRYQVNGAKLQVTEDQLPLVLQYRQEILQALKPDYGNVMLDLQTRREE